MALTINTRIHKLIINKYLKSKNIYIILES